MEAAIFVYFAGIVNSVKNLFEFIAVISSLSAFFSVFGFFFSRDVMTYELEKSGCQTKEELADKRSKLPKKIAKISIFFAMSFGLIAAMIPSEKTMYYMAGAYFGQKAIESEVAKDVYDVIELKVKGYKKELEKELNKEVTK